MLLKRQFFVSASQLIVSMILACIPRLFHSLFVPFGGGFRVAPPFKQFRQVIIATDVAWITCKNLFKQLLCLGVIACFYVLER